MTEVLLSTAFPINTQSRMLVKSWVQWWTTPTHLGMYSSIVQCISLMIFTTTEMLTPAFSGMSTFQWEVMPSDTDGVESFNRPQQKVKILLGVHLLTG